MTNTIEETNNVPANNGESFAPTLVEAPTAANAIVTTAMTEAELQTGLDFVREENKKFTLANAQADREFEQRFAEFLSNGFRNALDLLANPDFLDAQIIKIGLTPAKDTSGLLGQIAKVQLGSWVNGKWTIPSRRDERQARFYRIFKADPVKYHVGNLVQTIFDHKYRSKGILDSVKVKKVPVGKQEKADNLKVASKSKPLAHVKVAEAKPIKEGSYRLALVRVRGAGLDICDIVEGEDSTVEKLLDKWAARVAETTIVEDEAE